MAYLIANGTTPQVIEVRSSAPRLTTRWRRLLRLARIAPGRALSVLTLAELRRLIAAWRRLSRN